MKWYNINRMTIPVYLNLGGGNNCHPDIHYRNYISVDLDLGEYSGWRVKHDLRTAIPLNAGTVDRILTEDFIEHIKLEDIDFLLRECYRLLKVGGLMRIGTPDYGNNRNKMYLLEGKDNRCPKHITLIDYKLMKDIIDRSPFKLTLAKFYHYWDNGKFICEKINYNLGYIKRVPGNDPRCINGCSLIVDLFK